MQEIVISLVATIARRVMHDRQADLYICSIESTYELSTAENFRTF